MDNDQIRALWLEDTLDGMPIPESFLPKSLQGKGIQLITRELDANTAGDIMDACTDSKGKTNQKKLMAMMLIASVRNVDNPKDEPVWNNSFLQPLLSKNVKPLVMIAQQAIKQSGLNVNLDEEKKDSDPTIVEGSLSG